MCIVHEEEWSLRKKISIYVLNYLSRHGVSDDVPIFFLFPRLTSFYRLLPTLFLLPLLSPTPAGVSILVLLLRNNQTFSLLKLLLFPCPAAYTPSHSSRLPSVNSLLSPHISAPNKFSAALFFHKEMLILPPLSEVDPRPRSLQRGAGWSPGPQRSREGPPVTVPRVFEHKAPSHCAATRHRSPNASCL